ncbi:MAG: aspartate-semialdehyde dehydrogenase [Eubacteriales bacterium]|nr:aspartate-semialdehyde dehydrogenase [Eubacteriales bacterium]
MRIGIVGATGIVGRELVSLLATSKLKATELRLSATTRSVGKKVATCLGEQNIAELNIGFFSGLDLCFFCVSGEISETWLPLAQAQNVICIDNSSRYRMEADVPLVVPEVNGELLRGKPRIIANPNCIVAPLAMALNPIQRSFGLEDLWVSTYQSVSGAGQEAMTQLEAELVNYPRLSPVPGQFLLNVIGCIGSCDSQGHSQEERKIIQETRKILDLPALPVAVTAVRVPVMRGHCQAVTVITKCRTSAEEIREVLTAGNVCVSADAPEPIAVQGTNQVYVGRLRENQEHRPRSYSFWLAADNLRKGAALNALSIAEHWWSLQ